ncbi:alpha/beta fold hydrolase [Rhodococcus sp. WWJCD1]|uniref:alpha/beta fold hydrolase n=1 Tax=Rhodococcus sp. WWJCD1 TaxID=2022519 RepID=UPI001595767C|nr:alpha/beta fold hydrolase [Rhodococcus sp. WWJCD1]
MSDNVVLLHGLAGSEDTWTRVRALLDTSKTIVAVRLRGSTSIEDDALDVARHMRASGLSSATVVGHSRGGLVATSLAEQFPSLVERLVLVSTPPTRASRLTARSASEKILRVPGLGAAVWAAIPRGVLRAGLKTAFAPAPSVPDFAVADLVETGRSRLVANGDAIDHYLDESELSVRLSSVHCEVDVVYGLDDRRVDAAAMALSARGQGRRAFPLKHEGHGAPWTSAGAVADVVRGAGKGHTVVLPKRPIKPLLEPRRWTPPPAPARARKHTSSTPMGAIRRIELPGRGPEDVRIDSRGRIVTGIEDGRILRVTVRSNDSVVETLGDTGGRPLGIAVVDDSTLLICDSERGLLRLDADTGEIEDLVSEVDGVRLNFASNVVAAASGRTYFTASTRRFGFENYLADLLEHSGTGRLLVRDLDGSVRTLVDGIQFANGLTVSEDETCITVSETGSFRLARYRVDDAGGVVALDPLIENLPGFPDNLSADGDVVWVSLASPRVPLFDIAARLPGFVRKLAYSLPESVRSGGTTTWVMAVDGNGDVVHDVQSPSMEYSTVTSVVRAGSHLVFGSITESALCVIELPRSAAESAGDQS